MITSAAPRNGFRPQQNSKNDMLSSLGLDEEMVSMILAMGSSYIFEDGADWNTEIPHSDSLASNIVQIVCGIGKGDANLVNMFAPVLKIHSDIKSVKKRLNYRDMPGDMRDNLDAVILSAPPFELKSLVPSEVPDFISKRHNGFVHMIVDRLI